MIHCQDSHKQKSKLCHRDRSLERQSLECLTQSDLRLPRPQAQAAAHKPGLFSSVEGQSLDRDSLDRTERQLDWGPGLSGSWAALGKAEVQF